MQLPNFLKRALRKPSIPKEKIEVKENVEFIDTNGKKIHVKLAITEFGSVYFVLDNFLFSAPMDRDGTFDNEIGGECGECVCFGGTEAQYEQVLTALGRTDIERLGLCG